jgi:hypothetical protein
MLNQRWKTALLASIPALGIAGGVQEVEKVVITTSAQSPVTTSDSATEGTVSAEQIKSRPLLRPGELLEVVPGYIATQHSGDGKANQYFLRGFNLDHGTDGAVFLNGVPLNMPSHAHGQGYTDLNFVIPELIQKITYRKGPYAADDGNFSSAGSVRMETKTAFDAPFIASEFGRNQFARTVIGGSQNLGNGTLLGAFEFQHANGPWRVPEQLRKRNGVVQYAWKSGESDFKIAGSAYAARWTATDQIPQRAVDAGLIDRFGSLDASDGGQTRRASVSAQWTRTGATSTSQATAYLVNSALDLFSNFTYALDNPEQGDQFSQSERRRVLGIHGTHTHFFRWNAQPAEMNIGGYFRQDRLAPVALRTTQARVPTATIREDRVTETNASLFASTQLFLVPWARVNAGLRVEHLRVNVRSDTDENSSRANGTLALPKLALTFGPWRETALFLNAGHGLHSNDARGITTTRNIDFRDNENFGTAIAPVTPLVRTRGAEFGLRTRFVPALQTSLSVWGLRSASELVYVGDAGTTEASRASQRTGIELANYWTIRKGITVDADIAWSRARFTEDPDNIGRFVPGAITRTASVSASYERGPLTLGARARYFGPRSLVEDNKVSSASSTLVNFKAIYALSRNIELSADVFNALNRKANDIEYYYDSKLPGESGAITDKHIHPAEGRTFRFGLRWQL